MSRSYKKNPIIKYGKWITKRLANHRVRQRLKQFDTMDLPFSWYKRLVDSWDINDRVDRTSKQQYIDSYNNRKNYYHFYFYKPDDSLDNELKKWYKTYKRK